MDATGYIRAALVLGFLSAIALFFIVWRLLNIDTPTQSVAALQTAVAAPTQLATALRGTATAAATRATGVTAAANAYPNVHSSAGVTSPIVGTLSRGDHVEVVGRTADSAWLEIRFEKSPTGLGWVSADLMAVSAPIASLPVAGP